MATENAQLRRLLGITEHTSEPTVVVEVLYEPPDGGGQQRLVFNKGSKAGLAPGMPVIDEGGVVGQLVRVTPMTSEAALLTDDRVSIPVQVLRNGLRLIAFGTNTPGEIEVRYLSANADVRVGDVLTTSGLDGIYLPGLPVATVSRVDLRTDTAFAHIVAQPAARLRGESHVLVMDPVAAQLPAPSPTAEPAQITPVLNWSPASAPLADDAPVPTREVRHPPKGRKHP